VRSWAAQSAAEAIAIWQRVPDKTRVLDDEALAHVYLATARLKLGEVDGAMDAVAPVLELPVDRRTSWMRRRMADLCAILAEERFGRAGSAVAARERLYEFV
jgi:hypothetical protein